MQAKYRESDQLLNDSISQIESTYADDDAMITSKDVKQMAIAWSNEKNKLQRREADIKWERDYFMGKLLENEIRNKVTLEKLQDSMLLMFKEYRRHFEEQKTKLETHYRNLLDDAVHDALFSNTQKQQAEDRLRELLKAKP